MTAPQYAYLQVGEAWVRVDLIEAIGALDYAEGTSVRTVGGRTYSDVDLEPAAGMARLAALVGLAPEVQP